MSKEYKFRSNRIILKGDSHSMVVSHQIYISRRFPNDYDCVFMGDGGEGYEFGTTGGFEITYSNFKYINETLKSRNSRVFWIRGNHSNPLVWQQGWEFSNIILVDEGDVGVFPNGKKAIFVGGGNSPDRCVNREGFTYWKDEVTKPIDNVAKVQFMFSHDAPAEFNHSSQSLLNNFSWYVERDVHLIDDAEAQRKVVSKICADSGAKYVFSGHFHNHCQETKDGVTYKCININELFELDTDRYDI